MNFKNLFFLLFFCISFLYGNQPQEILSIAVLIKPDSKLKASLEQIYGSLSKPILKKHCANLLALDNYHMTLATFECALERSNHEQQKEKIRHKLSTILERLKPSISQIQPLQFKGYEMLQARMRSESDNPGKYLVATYESNAHVEQIRTQIRKELEDEFEIVPDNRFHKPHVSLAIMRPTFNIDKFIKRIDLRSFVIESQNFEISFKIRSRVEKKVRALAADVTHPISSSNAEPVNICSRLALWLLQPKVICASALIFGFWYLFSD